MFIYMNYLDDQSCFIDQGEFTCNQIERMYFHWLLYRDKNELCAEGEMEIGIVIEFGPLFPEEWFLQGTVMVWSL